MKKAFCTIVTASHFSYARILLESLRSSGNPETLYVLLVGVAQTDFDAPEGMTVVTMAELSHATPALMPFYYTPFELCNALKPFLVSHLLFGLHTERVIFLDSDLMVTDSFQRVWHELDHTSLAVTPHHFNPPSLDSLHTNEVDVIDLGFINGGFAAWKSDSATDKMLQWMRERFAVYGFYRHLGMAADQKLIPLLLSYYPSDIKVLRDPGLNIAYWNAHERAVTDEGNGKWAVNGQSVVFFHLSGCKLSHPGMPCAYISQAANDALFSAAPWLNGVVEAYQVSLEKHQDSSLSLPYEYDEFDGIRLNPAYRRLIFRDGRLDRKSSSFWTIWLTVRLRILKRLLTGVRPLS